MRARLVRIVLAAATATAVALMTGAMTPAVGKCQSDNCVRDGNMTCDKGGKYTVADT